MLGKVTGVVSDRELRRQYKTSLKIKRLRKRYRFRYRLSKVIHDISHRYTSTFKSLKINQYKLPPISHIPYLLYFIQYNSYMAIFSDVDNEHLILPYMKKPVPTYLPQLMFSKGIEYTRKLRYNNDNTLAVYPDSPKNDSPIESILF